MNSPNCPTTTTTCPHCKLPTRLIRCGQSPDHEGTHIFPTGFGHLPPYGNGVCPPEGIFSVLSSPDIELLRKSYVDKEGIVLDENLEKAVQWCEVFRVPMLTYEEVSMKAYCEATCPHCRIGVDSRTSTLLSMIFYEGVARGLHPYGYTLEQALDEVEEVERDLASVVESAQRGLG